MNPQYILTLADPRATLETVGGKGASLARMTDAGLPVPAGFHITTDAYRQFVAENGLQPRILDALKAADPAVPAALETASARIRDLFTQATIPPTIADEIRAAYTALSDPKSKTRGEQSEPIKNQKLPVAVRSSATAEDLPGASFAGQQETFLNIQDIPALLNAVRDCWASLWTARAIGYRARQGIAPDSVALAVVVQRLVPADVAGVMFTANPLNGNRDQIVINAAWGLGESIVSGKVTPDSFTTEKDTGKIVERNIAAKHMLTARVEQGVAERPVPEAQRDRPTLSAAQIAELAELGQRIESLYGMPMDIEWTLLDGTFAVVQGRPITALPEPLPPAPTHWPVPDPKAFTYRGSIVELLPDPLSPLFATLGVKAINDGTLRLFTEIVGQNVLENEIFVTINGYAYYHMQLGFRYFWGLLPRLRSTWNKFMRGEQRWRDEARPQYIAVIAHWQSRPLSAWSSAELLDGVAQIVAEAVNVYTIFQSGVIGLAMFAETGFSLFYEKFIKRRDDPATLTFLVGMDSAPIRAEKSLYDVAQWCRERPELAKYLLETPTGSLAAQLEAAPPPDGVAAENWREWQKRFRAHLAQHGHAIYDLDFAKATAADNPGPLLETCKMYLAHPGGGPYERQQKQIAQRETAVQAITGRIKRLRLKWFNKLLGWVQRYGPMREDTLNDIGLGYPLLRRMLRELGRRLVESGAIAEANDVYWLNETEAREAAAALDLSATPAAATEIIRERKAIAQAQKQVTPPAILPERSGFMNKLYEKMGPTRANPTTGALIKGAGASPGCVTGPARVLHGPEEFGDMQPGEVLVAAITTPAWTPLFAMAAAIVTDVGGPLSHGSIVAREYGIPAVLGTTVATRRIRNGQIITVDGSTGVVKLNLPGD